MKPVTARLALLVLPLALGLAACGQKGEEGGATSEAAPIAKIAPPAGKAWADMVVTTPEGGYRMGNPDAPIKVVEYASLTCPHCAEFAEKGLPRLRDDYIASGRVSLEFRNFVRDPYDTAMAMLTRCGTPDAFFGLTEQVFANQKDIFARLEPVGRELQAANAGPQQLFQAVGERGGLLDFFSARGIARDQGAACLAKTDVATKLANDVQAAADKYNIQGTPTFLVNGRNVEVATWEGLEPILQRAGAR